MDSRGPVHIHGTFWQENYRHEIQKLKLNQSMTQLSNFSKVVWTALKNLKKSSNKVIKAADKSGAAIVWQADLYRQDLQATRQLYDFEFSFYIHTVNLTGNQKVVKELFRTSQVGKNWQLLPTLWSNTQSFLLSEPPAFLWKWKFPIKIDQLFQHAVTPRNISRAV